ncbi:MAG: hypothetical protein IPH76_12795 [Xanthomonadales bacterium]|nr:hypothetical protein [Xanthomonadales bacterium]
MSPLLKTSSLVLALLAALLPKTQAAEFVYVGQLDDRGAPANGRYDLRIAAFGDQKSSFAGMAPIEFLAVEVRDGRFELRFDAALASARETWLEVAVRDAGAGDFATIPGRSKAIRAPLIGACWSSTGDAGTTGSNFLGTTDAQPLVLRTANVQSLRIEPSAELFGGSPITANVIAGSSANAVTAGVRGATIAGGGVPSGNSDPDLASEAPNVVTDHYGTVSGGYANVAGGGSGTLVDQSFATVGGGSVNLAHGTSSTVGGGDHNTANGYYSTIDGGSQNFALGHYSTVAGGGGNTAGSDYGSVSGGHDNCAGGSASWAGGSHAKVRPSILIGGLGSSCDGVPANGLNGDEGTFVWADHQIGDFVSTGTNQFLVRAAGGLWFGTSSTPSIPAGRFLNTSTGGYLSSSGVWTDSSSRTLKTGFAAIDADQVLDRVLALPIAEWSYRAAPDVRHLGPVAEDFHTAFGLGEGATHIASLDTGGVALAAIQGLNAKVEAKDSEIEALRGEIAALRALVEARLHGEH